MPCGFPSIYLLRLQSNLHPHLCPIRSIVRGSEPSEVTLSPRENRSPTGPRPLMLVIHSWHPSRRGWVGERIVTPLSSEGCILPSFPLEGNGVCRRDSTTNFHSRIAPASTAGRQGREKHLVTIVTVRMRLWLLKDVLKTC